MGMFDTFRVDDCDGQVKLYERVMDTFNKDDLLPTLELPVRNDETPEDYGIKLRNGGWVIVKNKMFFKYQKEPPCLTHLYDKWGHPWDFKNPKYN